VAGKEIAVKKCAVKLSAEERDRLEAFDPRGQELRTVADEGAHPVEGGQVGEGWSDSAISAALETSINTIGRLRRQVVEEGFEAALSRKYNPNSARPRIFDGTAEAKLIALTCSPAPRGSRVGACACSKRRFVELNIVAKVSDNTIGRTLKKRAQTSPQTAMGDRARRQRRLRGRHGRRAGNLPEAAQSRSSSRVSG
jgi:hypothetical protein